MPLTSTGLASEPIWKSVLQDWHEDLAHWVRHGLPRIVVILIIALVLTRSLGLITRKLVELSQRQELPSRLRSQQLRTLSTVVHSVGVFIIYFIALLQILRTFSVDVAPLLASAGIAGLAIGFGAQTLVHDVINGFFILVEHLYDIGDTVKIAGVQGTVEEMSLRKTVLRDQNGTVHSVPNSEIKIISNLTRDWAQVALQVAVDYSESSDRVIELLKEVGSQLRNDPQYTDLIVAELEVPGIERVNGPEVDYLIVTKVRPGKQYIVSRELRRRIKTCFEKNKIKAGAPNRMYVVEAPPPALQA